MVPPFAAVCWGEIDKEARAGQLSPGTIVPVTTTVPMPPSTATVPQVIVTGAWIVWPVTTLNGALVPEQAEPLLVVVVMVTVSPMPGGRPMLTVGVALGLVVLMAPEASTALVDENTF